MSSTEILKPSEQIVAAANAVEVIVAGDLHIGIKKPGILLQYRIVEVVGPETAKNMVYMNMVNPLLWVVEINGDPVNTPTTKRELEALIARLGDEGIAALMAKFVPKSSAADLKQIADTFAAAAKEAEEVESQQHQTNDSMQEAVKN